MDGEPIRRAVVIGVNNYKSDKIENLSGAVQDATEIAEILKGYGNFIIDESHFMVDERADADNIRTAISDLFWKTEECEIALFYFSGHGKRDHFEQGYLLPHDADHRAPFVKGIRIQELKDLFLRSVPKKTGIMILDCCYSGIATERGETSSDSEHVKSFREELRLDSNGSGRFILASAGADKTAREEERQHAWGDKHVHGLFSFQLIEGLNIAGGGKTRDEYTQVSLGSLIKHVDNAFPDGKHKPQFSCGSATGLDSIKLTWVKEELTRRRQERLQEVRSHIDRKVPIGIMRAIQMLKDLEANGLSCSDIDTCYLAIAVFITESKPIIYGWWIENKGIVYGKTLKSPWYRLVDRILATFDLEPIKNLTEKERNFIGQVIEGIIEGRDCHLIANDIMVLDKNSYDLIDGQPFGNSKLLSAPRPSARSFPSAPPNRNVP